MKLLAAADALASLSGHRRQQVWDAAALHAPPELLRDAPVEEDILELPEAPEGEEIVFDYAALGLSLRRHPLALLRSRLTAMRFKSSKELHDLPNGRLVRACGIVTLRQQPETAKGVIFVSLEDEDGAVQVVVWKGVREQQRKELMTQHHDRRRVVLLQLCNQFSDSHEISTPVTGLFDACTLGPRSL